MTAIGKIPKTQPSGSTQARTTAELAKFVIDTPYAAIPAPIVHATKQMILDEIIVTAATFNTPMAQALVRLKADQGGNPEATLMVDGRKLPATAVAYVHAQLANLLDADETMLNRMHTVSASVFAGLSMAEKTGASGKDLIAAIATGYDITARVGMSLVQYVPDEKGNLIFAPLFGWSWMTFGATATAGRLIGLKAPKLAEAFGQAFVTTPVYFDVLKNNARMTSGDRRASWHKYQMSGAMAEVGINAAVLVSHGWVAQEDLLDEGNEFWRSFAAVGCDWDAMYNDLGQHWYIGDCAIKPYPFCRYGHAGLDIFTRIVTTEKLKPEDIDDILLGIPPHELSETLASTMTIDEGLKLMVSSPSALALVAMGVPPGPKWFNADFKDERLRSIARKVRYEVKKEWSPLLMEQMKKDGIFRRFPAEVTVRTKSGTVFHGHADYALGDPWDPASVMSDERLALKAHQFLDGILPAKKIDALITAVNTLESAPDVRAIAQAMTA